MSNQPTQRAHMSRLFSIARGVCDSKGYSKSAAVFPSPVSAWIIRLDWMG